MDVRAGGAGSDVRVIVEEFEVFCERVAPCSVRDRDHAGADVAFFAASPNVDVFIAARTGAG